MSTFPTESLTLHEHRSTRGVALTPHERAALSNVRDVVVTVGSDDTYDIRPGSTVGSLSVDGRSILIRPKIGFDRALFLVSYAIDRALWSEEETSYAEAYLVVDAIASAFARATSRAVGRGLLEGYRYTEDALYTVRGRIRFADQLRTRLGIVPPVEVAFDEFTVDIHENRILRAALRALRSLGLRSVRVAEALRNLEAQFDEVSLVEYQGRRAPDVAYTRLNAHYRTAIELARFILRSTSYELEAGEVTAATFTIDMNRAFEDFVVIAMREALDVSASSLPQGVQGRLWLDAARRVELHPDVSWWSGSDCVFIGDVKYKRTDIDGESADLYQLLAYVVASGLDDGLLIYAAGEEQPTTHVVDMLGRRLHVRALELTGGPDEIVREVASLAETVRALRRRALRRVVAA
jgi:5-methylcytosine-specific restriction enzyme subunit McrC